MAWSEKLEWDVLWCGRETETVIRQFLGEFDLMIIHQTFIRHDDELFSGLEGFDDTACAYFVSIRTSMAWRGEEDLPACEMMRWAS